MIIKQEYQQTYSMNGIQWLPCGAQIARFQPRDFVWTAESLEMFTKLFCAFYPYNLYEPLPLLLWLALVRRANLS